MSTISIKPNNIPEYLKGSAFFANLVDEEDEVSIPSDCCKTDTTVTNCSELDELLRTLRFWGVDRIPSSAVHFVIDTPNEVWESVFEKYVTDLPYIAHLVEVVKCDRERQVCKAAEIGNLEIVHCLLKRGYPAEYKCGLYPTYYTRAVTIAARKGFLDILKTLHEHNYHFYEETAADAAFSGQLATLKYVLENGCPIGKDIMSSAFVSGHVEILQYLHETVGCSWPYNILNHTKYLHFGNVPCDETRLLQCLKYAHANGCRDSPDSCQLCIANNFPLLMRQLHEHGCPLNESAVFMAARNGRLECLKYALEQGAPQPHDLFCVSMLSGNVDIIQYLHDRGLPWPEEPLNLLHNGENTETLTKAVVCLKYAYKLGCPKDPREYLLADIIE